MGNKINLKLSQDEALILFEFLSRFEETDKLDIVDQAEKRVLWNLLCDLQPTLVEPLMKDYKKILVRARERVRDEYVPEIDDHGGGKDSKPCDGLIGKRLYEITFVMDYVQLRFDGDDKFLTINAFAPIRVTKAGKEYQAGDSGHKDALCSLITKNVKSVYFDEGKALEFQMESGEMVRISETDRPKNSPEWVNYIDDKDHRNDLYY